MSTEENKIKQVDTIFDTAMSEANKIYGEGGAADTLVNTYQESQNQLIKQQDDYLVSRLDQQKRQAEQSYTQEQSAAYSDYQKQVDPYGTQAEQLASSGLSNSGYADSLKTQAYVAYQNRVAVARQAYQEAVVNFNNAFTEAKMQNDSQRASLAYQVLQMQFENMISGFTYNYQLRMDKANALINVADATGDYQSLYEMVYADLEKNYNSDGDAEQSAYNFTDRDSAIEFLRSQGIYRKPMRENVWTSGHNANTPVKDYNYDSYSAYLNAFVEQYVSGNY